MGVAKAWRLCVLENDGGDDVVSEEADPVVLGLRLDALRLGLDFALHDDAFQRKPILGPGFAADLSISLFTGHVASDLNAKINSHHSTTTATTIAPPQPPPQTHEIYQQNPTSAIAMAKHNNTIGPNQHRLTHGSWRPDQIGEGGREERRQ
uniref:Uncharacterized protein n=1 Tax=Fagus sylvatica TaxID=28930 RepID=A0A2N9G6C4_FAGSY